MSVPIVLDRPPIVLCQCVPPCHMPFYIDEVLSPDGCRRPQGHPPPCSAEGPDNVFTYREPPEKIGPRLIMRIGAGDIWHATCHRCGRSYALGMVTLGAAAVDVALAIEDAMEEALPGLTEAAAAGGVARLSRVEVVDETGRAYTRHDADITTDVQDEGRTLKVFVRPGGVA